MKSKDLGPEQTAQRALMTSLEAALAAAGPEDLPCLLADIERLKAIGWLRLTRTASPGSASVYPAETEPLLTVKEVAARLNVHPSFVYGLVRGGRDFPTKRFGKYVRVAPAELKAWLERLPRLPLDKSRARPHTPRPLRPAMAAPARAGSPG